MIHCPVCQSKELEGTIFCSECGAQLVRPGAYLQDERSINRASRSSRAETLSASEEKPAPLWLKIIETGEILKLPEWPQATLGRVSEGQDLLPDVDLTPYHAFELGVSRLHAMFVVQGNRPCLIDLGSANGTKVNEVRLVPKTPQELANGDRIALGKLQIQVLIQIG